jgi:hypothetical protein
MTAKRLQEYLDQAKQRMGHDDFEVQLWDFEHPGKMHQVVDLDVEKPHEAGRITDYFCRAWRSWGTSPKLIFMLPIKLIPE